MDLEFVRAGPLIRNGGFTDAELEAEAPNWTRVSEWIVESLGFDKESLTEEAQKRVFHYYLPIAMWIQRLKKHHTEQSPLVLGISAPQGCGKSTMVACLCDVFEKMGMNVASVSIDDFYLTHADQKRVAAEYEDNPLLQCRGNALTHDLALGTETLQNLKDLPEGSTVKIPRYDKSAFGGKGDRMEHEQWIAVEGPLDLIFLEGWMLGFRPMSAEHIQSIDEHLLPINEALKEYEHAWDAFVEAWLVIKVADPSWVGKWRLEAERGMKKRGKPGMSDEAIQAFVNCYMPAYNAYLPELYAKGPTTMLPKKCLIVEVDVSRTPVAEQPEPVSQT